jgi:hypothetical protein
MLDPSIFTEVDPLTNRERFEQWRRKWWSWKAETYWSLTHPGEDGLVVDQPLGDIADVPPYLRRQAE